MQSDLLDLDRFDLAILKTLAAEGRLSVTELARRIGLSKSPTQARLKRLEASGAILGYRAILDPIQLGLDHARIPEIEQAHLIAGNFDYLLKVRTSDMRAYRRVLADHVSKLPHIASTSTYVAMEAVKENGLAEVT